MSEYVLADKNDLSKIADALRSTSGSNETYTVPELSTAAVRSISSGGGGVSSWNDLTDKPFSSEIKEMYIISETDFMSTEGAYLSPLPARPIVGESYIVTYDGVEYSCVMQEIYLEEIGRNAFILGSTDSSAAEYPFNISIIPDGIIIEGLTIYAMLSAFAEPTTSYICSVYGKGESIKTIDGKYLPENIPQSTFIDVALTSDGMGLELVNGSFMEAHAAFMKGYPVFARMNLGSNTGMFVCVSASTGSLKFNQYMETTTNEGDFAFAIQILILNNFNHIELYASQQLSATRVFG